MGEWSGHDILTMTLILTAQVNVRQLQGRLNKYFTISTSSNINADLTKVTLTPKHLERLADCCDEC